MLARAGERSGSLGATREGRRYYEQAAALADDGIERAGLHLQAGRLAVAANEVADGRHLLERAISAYREAGDARREALAHAALADVDVLEGRLDVAAERMRQAITQIDSGEPTLELATVLAALGRVLALLREVDDALPVLDRALALAERLARSDVFVEAVISKAVAYQCNARLRESRLLLEAAVAQSREEQLGSSELRALNNLAVVMENLDRFSESPDTVARIVELARRRGDRRWEAAAQTGLILSLYLLGRWDEAEAIAQGHEQATNTTIRSQLVDHAHILVERGDVDAAAAWISAHEPVGDPSTVFYHDTVEASVLRRQGRPGEALDLAARVMEGLTDSPVEVPYKFALVQGLEAAFELGDLVKAEQLLAIPESLDKGMVTPFLRAHALRFRARLDAARGHHERVDERFRHATALLCEFGFAFHVAVTQLEHAEWLAAQSRGEEAAPLLAEAQATFEHLRARPWIERAAPLAIDARRPGAEPRDRESRVSHGAFEG
jgi:tetratricopeptide (TPR) repeat protein